MVKIRNGVRSGNKKAEIEGEDGNTERQNSRLGGTQGKRNRHKRQHVGWLVQRYLSISYYGGDLFHALPKHRPSVLKLPTNFLRPPGKYQVNTSIRSRWFPYESFLIHYAFARHKVLPFRLII